MQKNATGYRYCFRRRLPITGSWPGLEAYQRKEPGPTCVRAG